MITAWRMNFQLLSMPFYFVQLAPYCNGDAHCSGTSPPARVDVYLPALRESQEAALRLPSVGMASAIDLGDQTAPAGSVHPRNKTLVGKRLADNALALTYGQAGRPYQGPHIYEAIQTGPTQVTVSFQQATLYGGLTSFAVSCPGGGMSPYFCTGSGNNPWCLQKKSCKPPAARRVETSKEGRREEINEG